MLLQLPHSKEVMWVRKAATTVGPAISQLEVDKSRKGIFLLVGDKEFSGKMLRWLEERH